ncbi:hypothetical protein BH23ACT6_BH23ACT6_20370 [soil metagenome]
MNLTVGICELPDDDHLGVGAHRRRALQSPIKTNLGSGLLMSALHQRSLSEIPRPKSAKSYRLSDHPYRACEMVRTPCWNRRPKLPPSLSFERAPRESKSRSPSASQLRPSPLACASRSGVHLVTMCVVWGSLNGRFVVQVLLERHCVKCAYLE